MFKKNKVTKNKLVNFILMNGGVGDHVASLTAMNYIIQKYDYIQAKLWVPDFLLGFSKHLLSDHISINDFTSMAKNYNENLPTKTTKWDGVTSPMKIHCLDYAFLKLCDENPEITHKNYLKITPDLIDTSNFMLPKKYIVITTGYTAKVREFPAYEINKLIEYANKKKHEVIFLGQTKTQTGSKHVIEGNFDAGINFHKGTNLVNQTTLLEAAKIMGEAKAVIGVDNGLLHVAGCTDVPIIGGFTTVTPEIRMPVRNNILGWNFYPITPNENLGCKFCQEKTNFLYGHDYRNCIYKNFKCTTQMTAEKFINKLEGIL